MRLWILLLLLALLANSCLLIKATEDDFDYDTNLDDEGDDFDETSGHEDVENASELNKAVNLPVVTKVVSNALNKNKEEDVLSDDNYDEYPDDGLYDYTSDFDDNEFTTDDEQIEDSSSKTDQPGSYKDLIEKFKTDSQLTPDYNGNKNSLKYSRSKLFEILSKPGILAGIIGGIVIGLLTAILLIMFIVYRMRKRDEGSYALEDTKKPLSSYEYRNVPTKEFYA